MKTCSKCGIEKPLDHFHKRKASIDGLQPKCKACVSTYLKCHYDANRDAHLANKRRYYIENRESLMQKSATRYRLNNAAILRSMAEYYRRHRTERLQYQKAVAKDTRARFRPRMNAYAAAYRAAKSSATPAWADQEKIAEYYFAADFLSMVTGEWYHVDHMVPLQSKDVCGLHNQFNLRVIPGSENQSKGNRLWPDMP